MKPELIEELKTALANRDAARSIRNGLSEALAELKTKVREANAAIVKLDTTVEEIQHELVTGETGLDLVDAAARNGHAAVDDGDPRVAAATDRMKEEERAKRRERDARRRERERADTRTTATPNAPPTWVDGRTEIDETEPWPKQVIETTPAGGSIASTTADVDRELYHALVSRKSDWLDVITAGATNGDILSILEGIWPRHGRTFTEPSVSGGKTGYTISFAGGVPSFWVGRAANLVQATYYANDVVAAVRRILGIPTPAQAAKIAKATFREPAVKTPARPAFVERPVDDFADWDGASLANAAEDLGVAVNDLLECHECGAVFRREQYGRECPKCGETSHGFAVEMPHAAKRKPRSKKASKP